MAELSMLSIETTIPSLSDPYLAGRSIARLVQNDLARSGVFLHGAPGSGKSSLAAEAAQAIAAADGRPLFWHDFGVAANQTVERILLRLGLHLFSTMGLIDLIEACLDEQFLTDPSAAVTAAVTALSQYPQILVFDNLHAVHGRPGNAIQGLLEKITWTAERSGTCVVVTSWNQPPNSLRLPVRKVNGLTGAETTELLELHGLVVSNAAQHWIADLAEDITCVEHFVRTPEWRAAVEAGEEDMQEPAELLQHWLDRYLSGVPADARQVLLALAVLEQAEPRDIVDRTASVANFGQLVSSLQHSPPLIRADGSRLSVHTNVRRAILAVTDHAAVDATRRRAASVLENGRRYLGSARLLAKIDDPATVEKAIRLTADHREAIIANGSATLLQDLIEDLRIGGRVPDSALRHLHSVVASVLNIKGDYAGAADRWAQALRFTPAGTAEAAAVRNRRADSLRMGSRYDDARDEYGLAARLLAEPDSPYAWREAARAHLGLAKLNRLRANYAVSESSYKSALDAYQAVDDIAGIIEVEFGLGEVRRLQGEWAESGRAYLKSLRMAEAQNNLERMAYGFWGVGEIARLTGDLAQAEQSHHAGLELCVTVDDTRSQGWALLCLAETCRQDGRHEEADDHYAAAMEKFIETKSFTEQTHTRLGQAENARARGSIEVEVLRKVSETYRSTGLAHCYLQSEMALAMALRVIGEHDTAAECLARAATKAAALALMQERERIRQLVEQPDEAPPVVLNFP